MRSWKSKELLISRDKFIVGSLFLCLGIARAAEGPLATPLPTPAARTPTVGTENALVIDGTAATVGKTLITLQQAKFFRALQRFHEGDKKALEPVDAETLRLTVQKMALEEMVFAEMKSLKFEGGPRAEAERLLRADRGQGRDREKMWAELLNRYGKTETVAIDRFWKSQQVDRFIQKKAETLTPVVTDAEIERYYKQNQARLGSDFAQLKPNIILLLKKQRMQQGLEEWVKYLKDKYGVMSLLEN